jgi:DNA-binding transcriptional MerR regulator
MVLTGIEIPDKRYFRIGEVSAITGVEPYVLRYWETEFPKVKPSRSRSGQRLYKRRDIEILLLVKDLLYQKKFTIAGARKYLNQNLRGSELQDGDDGSITLEEIREELAAIKDLLNG